MPIYEYRCTNGHQFDLIQRMSDEPLTECTDCGAAVQKVLSAPAIHFKGSGFYNTDYGRRNGSKSSDSSSSEGGGADKSDGASSTGSSSSDSNSSSSTSAGSSSSSSSGSSSSTGSSPSKSD